ncbi:MAG: DUF2892 domain-containing protein [Lutibacter sp.]|nr:DUF2892 domain-containing protein [Lutibacter sp.]MBP9600421.1 DUF2892 domain-containing protein [Lutibacter sp.]
MKKNIGSTDKIVRMVLAIAIGYFAYSADIDSNVLQYILFAVAAIILVTLFISFCPLYTLFGVNTCDKTCEVNK